MVSRPKRAMLNDRLREDLLYRLRWNVLAPLDDIKIRTGAGDPTTDVPLFDSHLANESIANPPISRIDEVYMGDLVTRAELRHETEWKLKQPTAPTINNEDDSPITLEQFVKELHAYMNLNMEILKQAKTELYGRLLRPRVKTLTTTPQPRRTTQNQDDDPSE